MTRRLSNNIFITLLIITFNTIAPQIVRADQDDSIIVPQPVPSVTISEERNPGDVLLTWEAPDYDTDGNFLIRDRLTYMVYKINQDNSIIPLFDHKVVGRTIIYQLCPPEEAQFAQFAVQVYYEDVPSPEITKSARLAVGLSRPLPYLNNFTPTSLQYHITEIEYPEGSYQGILPTKCSDINIMAGDDDDYVVVVNQIDNQAYAKLATGKINFSDSDCPKLSLRHYKWDSSDRNVITLSATMQDKERIEIATIDHSDCNPGWNTSVVDLDLLKHKKGQLEIAITFITHDNMILDTLAVYDYIDGVEEISNDHCLIEAINGHITVSGISPATKWNIYNYNGQIIETGVGNVSLPLSQGVY
ncbi:MAG: hypothetical protein K2H86_04500, partial [Muribaculaceae bacterium]|nr:hypothetical protein [Muribaculaceae bacterium]